jgi:dihydroorotate dehydrogenase (NAD+) catalytic subunit
VVTASFNDPGAPMRIVEELSAELRARGIEDVADVIGAAHRPAGSRMRGVKAPMKELV